MIPKEFHIAGVYLPPLLVVSVMALVAAWATAKALDRWRLTRFIAFPQLVFLSIFALYVAAFGTFVVRV